MYFLKDDIIKIDDTVIREMKHSALQNTSGKLRYCFHENENSGMQEMLFVSSDIGYARPHMHRNVAESHVVIDGEGYCVLFGDSGNVIDSFKVSRKNKYIYRVQKGIWHMVLPITEQMVIYEVREGKFDKDTNVFPEWAPKEDELEKIKKYKQDLIRRVGGID